MNGSSGLVRPAPKRLVPLLSLTAKVAKLGYASVALLEVLAGAWVSVLQFRRRTLCLLDAIYVAQRGRGSDDVVRISGHLQDELWLLAILGPIICTDMRAQSIPEVFLSDAAEEAQAVVSCPIPQCLCKRTAEALPHQRQLEQASFPVEGLVEEPCSAALGG